MDGELFGDADGDEYSTPDWSNNSTFIFVGTM